MGARCGPGPVGLALMLARCQLRVLAATIFVIATLVTLFAGILANKFLNGHLKEVNPLLAVLPNCWLTRTTKASTSGRSRAALR